MLLQLKVCVGLGAAFEKFTKMLAGSVMAPSDKVAALNAHFGWIFGVFKVAKARRPQTLGFDQI
jgi:hypothetical protein